MLENWLSPISAAQITDAVLQPWQLGSRIDIHSGTYFPELKGVQIALIGIGEHDANAARRALYALSFPFEGLRIADLGNFRKNQLSFIIPTVKELLESRICPVLISNDMYFGLSLYKAAQQILTNINLVIIDEQIRYDTRYQADESMVLNPILAEPDSQLFHLGLIGHQAHFTAPEILRDMEYRNYDLLRLGYVKANFPEIEPVIRDGDLCWFNLAALKQAEAPGQSSPSPSGFFIEEAAQICRYAGMSDKLKAFGLFGFRTAQDKQQLTAKAVAQMLWYFLEGFHNRRGDFPASTDGLVEYIVDLKQTDYQITFWKSNKTGRWWIQVPVETSEKNQRHRLIPCSYNDYKLACQDELPERLLQAFRRFL